MPSVAGLLQCSLRAATCRTEGRHVHLDINGRADNQTVRRRRRSSPKVGRVIREQKLKAVFYKNFIGHCLAPR